MNIRKGEAHIPILQSRFYGTATNVQAYANQLRRNGYSYQDKDGNTYQSGAYSAVHKADAVGNKWGLGLGGSNDTTGGACWLCYSHSSYYGEVPDPILHKEAYKEFERIWGKPKYEGHNPSTPIFVQPTNSRNKEYFNEKPF